MRGGMKLICNSIPKSGTYLLAAIAEYFGFRDQNIRFMDNGTNVVDANNILIDFRADESLTKFANLEQQSYAPSHLSHSPEVANHLRNSEFRHLFIYRHPYDVLYAYVRFVTLSKSFRAQSEYNAQLQDRMLSLFECDEQRVVDVYQNMQSAFSFEKNLEWLSEPACFSIRFEDLYFALLEAEKGKETKLLDDVAKYLEFEKPWSASEFFSEVYGRGPTFSSGKAKVGRFASLDTSLLKPLIDDVRFTEIVDAYGYDPKGFVA
tara:strand:+ start:188 stop:976 length:789 start_codon:yes stop_codon:yes gene_type:complete